MRFSGQITTALVLGALAGFTSCAVPRAIEDPAAARAQFERFVALEGDWLIVGGDHAQGATHSYRTIASGSAVVETVFPGQPHEMVTLYHLDGPALVLTHYCALGNQPRMLAEPSTGDSVQFRFVSGGNLASLADAHMHDARFTFIDDAHFRSIWSHWDGGEEIDRMEMELSRISD